MRDLQKEDLIGIEELNVSMDGIMLLPYRDYHAEIVNPMRGPHCSFR